MSDFLTGFHALAVLYMYAYMTECQSLALMYAGAAGVATFLMLEWFDDDEGFKDKDKETLRAELENPSIALHHIMTAKNTDGKVTAIGQGLPAEVAALVTKYLGYFARKGHAFVPGELHPLGDDKAIEKVMDEGSWIAPHLELKVRDYHDEQKKFFDGVKHIAFMKYKTKTIKYKKIARNYKNETGTLKKTMKMVAEMLKNGEQVDPAILDVSFEDDDSIISRDEVLMDFEWTLD